MSNKKNIKIYQQMKRVLKSRKEEELKNFLIDNLLSFPKKTQEEIIFAFFEEALVKSVEGIESKIKLHQRLVDFLNLIEKAKKK